MNVFERYLSLWVAACMLAGVAIGKLAPDLVGAMRVLPLFQPVTVVALLLTLVAAAQVLGPVSSPEA
jgi:ACR3 family arsenite transporter